MYVGSGNKGGQACGNNRQNKNTKRTEEAMKLLSITSIE